MLFSLVMASNYILEKNSIKPFSNALFRVVAKRYKQAKLSLIIALINSEMQTTLHVPGTSVTMDTKILSVSTMTQASTFKILSDVDESVDPHWLSSTLSSKLEYWKRTWSEQYAHLTNNRSKKVDGKSDEKDKKHFGSPFKARDNPYLPYLAVYITQNSNEAIALAARCSKRMQRQSR